MLNWESLQTACLTCTSCPLSQTRHNVVFGVGPQDAEVMFVGEGPGWRKPSSCFPARSAGSSACWSAISLTTEKSERTSWTSFTPFWTGLRAARNRGGEPCWKFSFHRLF